MKSNLFIITSVAFLAIPAITIAFTPLVGIPGITDATISFETYINTLYSLSISIAALLAVIKIIVAGVKWMLSDVVTNKQEAKSDIQSALLGLLIIASTFLILNQINPELTRTNLITSTIERVTGGGSGGTGSPLTQGGVVLKTDETVSCIKDQPGEVGWCSNEEAICGAGGGKVIRGNTSNGSNNPDFVCSYSDKYSYDCKLGTAIADGTQPIVCNEAEQRCLRQDGIWTQDNTEANGICRIPFSHIDP